jgi:hypothetical protein
MPVLEKNGHRWLQIIDLLRPGAYLH